jgi:hypothetical protein
MCIKMSGTLTIILVLLFTFAATDSDFREKELDTIEFRLDKLQKEVNDIRNEVQLSNRHLIAGDKRVADVSDVAVSVTNQDATDNDLVKVDEGAKIDLSKTASVENRQTETKVNDQHLRGHDKGKEAAAGSKPQTQQQQQQSPASPAPDPAVSNPPPSVQNETTAPPNVQPVSQPAANKPTTDQPVHADAAANKPAGVDAPSQTNPDDDGGAQLVEPLKSLLDVLRQKLSRRCAPVGQLCGFHHGRTECCRGLRCSSDWSGTCAVDCVAPGESCAQNWFCCDGRQCLSATVPPPPSAAAGAEGGSPSAAAGATGERDYICL